MKKIISIILIMVTLLFLSGCSSNVNSQENENLEYQNKFDSKQVDIENDVQIPLTLEKPGDFVVEPQQLSFLNSKSQFVYIKIKNPYDVKMFLEEKTLKLDEGAFYDRLSILREDLIENSCLYNVSFPNFILDVGEIKVLRITINKLCDEEITSYFTFQYGPLPKQVVSVN